MQKITLFGVVVLLTLLNACAANLPNTPIPFPVPAATAIATSAPTPNPLQGGILAAFELNGQHFNIWVTNPNTIQQILDLRDGKSDAKIPNGKILNGPGPGDSNAPWSWHLDPNEIEMAEFTTEVCDAEPQYVEDHLKDFVDVVGRYCPWSATLVSIQDFR